MREQVGNRKEEIVTNYKHEFDLGQVIFFKNSVIIFYLAETLMQRL